MTKKPLKGIGGKIIFFCGLILCIFLDLKTKGVYKYSSILKFSLGYGSGMLIESATKDPFAWDTMPIILLYPIPFWFSFSFHWLLTSCHKGFSVILISLSLAIMEILFAYYVWKRPVTDTMINV